MVYRPPLIVPFGRSNAVPPSLRVDVDPTGEYSTAERAVHANLSQINRFVAQQRQQVSLSPIAYRRAAANFDGLTLFYTNNNGLETIHYVIPTIPPAPSPETTPLEDYDVTVLPACCAVAYEDGTILYAYAPDDWKVAQAPGLNPSVYFSTTMQRFYVQYSDGGLIKSASTYDFKNWKDDDWAPTDIIDSVSGMLIFGKSSMDQSGAEYDRRGNEIGYYPTYVEMPNIIPPIADFVIQPNEFVYLNNLTSGKKMVFALAQCSLDLRD